VAAWLAAAALALAPTQPATATVLPVNATLELAFGGLATMTFVGGAPAASSAGLGGAATLPAGSLSGVASVALSPPFLTLIDGLGIAAPGATGTLAGAQPMSNQGLGFGGTIGVMGLNAAAYLLMSGAAVAEIPLATVGVGGTQMYGIPPGPAGTIIGAPYQLGMLTLMGSLNTVPHTVMATGRDGRTAAGKGTLVLVSPTTVSFGVIGSVGSISTLTLQYVPEPDTSLLVACGVFGLARAGRKLRRS
jgi:hypothetical protein